MSSESGEEFVKVALKKRILEYSVNNKNFAKWFEISEVKCIEDSFTAYKVVYRFLPKDLNDSIKEITTWKRFRDFKELNQFMHDYHVSLHRRDKFPEFPKSKYFGRFDENTVEERRQSSLKLLQFIGSQAHLYKHDKFIDFLIDGHFNDQATLTNDNKILIPLKPNSSEVLVDFKEPTIVQVIQELANCLSKLINQLDSTTNRSDYENVNLFLNKSLRYINSAVSNENLNEHFASYKLLKSAANNLQNFVNDEQSNVLDSVTVKFLSDLIEQLKRNSANIENANCLDLKDTATPESVGANTTHQAENELGHKTAESNIANDWILSDFNLSSNDFNSQLTLISGNLFDLNFTYQLFRVLNVNCLIMKERSDKSVNSKKYILKNLRKSSSPNVDTKVQVPINRIPYMCPLIKYYETDTTIFLLLEFFPHGRLFQYLINLSDIGHTYLKLLNEPLTGLKAEKKSVVNRRRSFTYKLNNSFTNLETISKTKQRSKSFRTNQGTKVDLNSIGNSFKDRLTINTDDTKIKMKISSSSSSSMSSSDSLDNKKKSDGISKSDKQFMIPTSDSSSSTSDSTRQTTSNKRVSPLMFISNSLKSIRKSPVEKPKIQITDENFSIKTETDFMKETRKWLVQLFVAVESLHELNIICKDLRPDNLLLSSSGDLKLTYFSKWNLVDDKLHPEAVDHFYAAPELCGLVNYTVSEASDWWSYGVIAFEMLTMNKFSDINSSSQLYVDNLTFPTDFTDQIAMDLIRKLICLNPSRRLSCKQIREHVFFKSIEWSQFTNV